MRSKDFRFCLCTVLGLQAIAILNGLAALLFLFR
jgi:hypothetical protein